MQTKDTEITMKVNDDLSVLVIPVAMGPQTMVINLSLIHDAANGPTLVDTGVSRQSPGFDEAMAEAGVRAADLKRIILTHQDMDHIGGLHDLAAETGARVLAHEIEVPHIDGSKPLVKLPPAAVLETMPQLKIFINRLKGTPVDEPLQDNSHLDLAGGVRVIFTPGHTPGHISLYLERTKTLIAGDALTAKDGQLLGPNASATPDMPLAMQSVSKLAALDVDTIVCYHGGIVSEDANGQLRRLAQPVV